jgi:NTP pyrophosphatase (non-canonical NTP hydrolase)
LGLRNRHKESKTDTQIKEGIKDELADILAEVLFISQELDIDLEEAWKGMVKSDHAKISARS